MILICCFIASLHTDCDIPELGVDESVHDFDGRHPREILVKKLSNFDENFVQKVIKDYVSLQVTHEEEEERIALVVAAQPLIE